MKRRSFFGLIGALPAVTFLANYLPAPAVKALRLTTLEEIMAHTIRHRSEEIAANVLANNALLFKLKERGVVKPFTGGVTLMASSDDDEKITFASRQIYP